MASKGFLGSQARPSSKRRPDYPEKPQQGQGPVQGEGARTRLATWGCTCRRYISTSHTPARNVDDLDKAHDPAWVHGADGEGGKTEKGGVKSSNGREFEKCP